VVPEFISTVEIVGPMLLRYAPQLAAADLAAALRGDEVWCQGFSEPEAGSDLGSLRTRAVADGDSFVVNGQKMWSSFGHVSRRCSLLARTGDPDSGYRGLTMMWLDMEWPGITVVPTACASGRSETAEIFLDDVRVPASRVVGKVGGGWEAVMYLLQFERGAYAWLRQAEMLTDLGELLAGAGDVPGAAEAVGDAYLSMFALRSLAANTVGRLAAGEPLGPEISVGKIVLGTTEQTVADTARELLWPALELEDSLAARDWRRAWAYSRITTIYGGAIEVQRDLVAERLLGLPRGREG
jgi:alkylation response protein AidB-like acyl-CoA dehydrogenase